MRWWLYNLLFSVGYCAMMPKFLMRMRKRGGYRAHFAQRFGRYEPEVAAALRARRRIWVHAVSVGEAFAAGKFIEELRRQSPDTAVVLSTTSSTGYAVCRELVGPEDVLIYFPLDFPPAVRRALDAVRPTALVLTESELWPNMLLACARRGIPTMLVNGRVSNRSFPRYRALRYFFGPVLQSFRLLLVQFERDRERLLAMGAPAKRVRVMGTVKFDVTPPAPAAQAAARAGLAAAGIRSDELLLLGASTWPGEEKALMEAFLNLREKFPCLRLALVPRHMERGDEVEALLMRTGLRVSRRSRTLKALESADAAAADGVERKADSSANSAETDAVLLADTTGELLAFCEVADLVFVGKTLPPNVGGQNMIEPAALGKPVVLGPHTENFDGAMTILRNAEAVREITSTSQLEGALEALLADQATRAELGRKAAATVAAQAGALERAARAVLEALPTTPR